MLHRSHKLLVGVPSYGAPLALSRRQHIRNLSGARSLSHGARLVFVLPEDDAHAEDGGWADVWRVPLPAAAERRARHNYGLEKWLLCDAFLRRAVRERAGFDFYALADDDTLFNLTTLHARLHPFAAAPQAHLVFGSVEECASHAARYGSKPRLAEQRPVRCSGLRPCIGAGFMWHPAAMISACFAYSSRRWEVARRTLAQAGGDVAALPRKHRECVNEGNVGPFPCAPSPPSNLRPPAPSLYP